MTNPRRMAAIAVAAAALVVAGIAFYLLFLGKPDRDAVPADPEPPVTREGSMRVSRGALVAVTVLVIAVAQFLWTWSGGGQLHEPWFPASPAT